MFVSHTLVEANCAASRAKCGILYSHHLFVHTIPVRQQSDCNQEPQCVVVHVMEDGGNLVEVVLRSNTWYFKQKFMLAAVD